MNYFSDYVTRDDIRNAYRRLAKVLHPDVGGSTEKMQTLNAQYDEAMDKATRAEMPDRSEGSYSFQSSTNKKIREAIEKAIRYPFLQVELCGWWVWVSGTTKRGITEDNDAAIDALKTAGYRWSGDKSKWYFAGIPAKGRGEDMGHIRAKYGSQTFKAKAGKKAETAGELS